MSFNALNQVQNITTFNPSQFVDSKISALLSPKGAKGIVGWEFDIPKTEDIRISADITDHYTENNSFLNDHIIIKPIEITLTGYIGELVFRPNPTLINSILAGAVSFSMMANFISNYTPSQMAKIEKINNIVTANVSNVALITQQTINVVTKLRGEGFQKTKQEIAYTELKSMMIKKQFLTVQTPWQYFDNLVIKELSFSQDESSNDYSDISITLKEIRISEVKYAKFDQDIFKIPEVQKSETKDIGKQPLESVAIKVVDALHD